MRMLGVELTRFFSRRAIIVLMILGALAVSAVAVGILYTQRPVSSAELASAELEAQAMNDQPYTQRHLAKCIERTDNIARCERNYLVEPENLIYPDQLRPAQFKNWLIPMSGLTAAVGLLIGATFIGADIASGSVGTQLLFQPSRWKVWTAKGGAVALGVAAFSAASLLLANGVIWFLAKAWDRPIRVGLFADYSVALGRGVVFAAASALVGFGVVMVARHTAAALGLLAVYGIAAEAVVRAIWTGSERWLLSNHVAAFIGGPFHREIYLRCGDNFGECNAQVISFTLPWATLYLGAGLLCVLAASWLVFQRRDVA